MPVILHKNFPHRVTDAPSEIRKRLGRGGGRSFLYVVPTKRKLRDVQREFLRALPGGVAPSFHLYTLETLAAELFALLCPPRRVVAGPAQSVLVNEAVHSLRDELRYFRIPASNRLPRGTVQKLVESINAFKEKGVYLSLLYAELEAAEPEERLKLRDILSIYEAYEKSLGDHFIDSAGMLKSVNAAWDPAASPGAAALRFSGVDAIIVSGFDEFSDPELTMLSNLSGIPGTGMLVSFDYHLENDEVFGHLKENYEKFLTMGFRKAAVPRPKRPTFEDHIRQQLFRRQTRGAVRPPPEGGSERYDCRENVSLYYVRDREQEVELVAKLIKDLAAERPDRDLSSICVATYRPQHYTKLFREAFERFGIPANITDRYSLDQSPLVVALLSLLDVQERNFRLRDIMRALSSPYLKVPSGGGSVDAGNLYDIGTRFKVTAGRNVWQQRIERRLAEVREELAAAGGDAEEARLRREETLLRRGMNDLGSLTAILKRFGSRMSPKQFRDRVLSLLEDLQVVECILRVSPSVIGYDQIEKDVRAYQKFKSFLDEFLEILALERGGSVHEPLSYYIDRLRTAVSEVLYNVRQRYGYGVVVTSFDETRGLQFDVMVIVGLVDGEFPPAYRPEIFHSSARRRRDERFHLTEHRYLFYQALTNFSGHLYLTVPKYDGETPVVPSSFIRAFLQIAEPEDLRGGPPARFSEKIYSEHDLLSRFGGRLARSAQGAAQPADVPDLPGVGGELLACMRHMRHAAAVELSRISRLGLPGYNGRIFADLAPESQDALARLREGIFSVSQLESYGRCPFQYFAGKVLRLNVIPEIEEGVSPLERGDLLHEIMFEFYVGRRERKLPPLSGCTDETFREAVADLLAIAARRLAELDAVADVFWEIDKETILGSGSRKGILKELLELEREAGVAVAPAYFEVAFGPLAGLKAKTDPTLRLEEPLVAGGVRLRGKIDRVDAGKERFRIIDYKTGSRSLPDRREIDLGVSLQLPVYLRAVEQILSANRSGGPSGAAGIYYWLKEPVEQKLGLGSAEHLDEVFQARKQAQLVETDEELERIVEQAIGFVNDYVARIGRGEFPVEPKLPERVCSFCEFKTVCRIGTISLGEIGNDPINQ